MKKQLLLIIILLLSSKLMAQEIDSTLYKWTPSLLMSVNLSQIAFKNWSKGGENAMSFTLGVDWVMNYKSDRWSFKNQLIGAWGQSKTGSEESKVTANMLFNETVFYFKPGWLFEPYVGNIIRSPITKGYDYETVPKEQIVAFFDPGYITQSIGFAYNKSTVFQTRLGLAFEESFADKFAARYTDDAGTSNTIEKFRFETGIESISDLILKLDDNIIYKSKLRLFSGFDRLSVWDVAWDNNFTAEVNKWLNVNLTFFLVYKASETIETQMQEAIQIGVVYNLF